MKFALLGAFAYVVFMLVLASIVGRRLKRQQPPEWKEKGEKK